LGDSKDTSYPRPSKSDHKVEKELFSVESSKITSRRLPELLRAFTAAQKQQRSNARHHRILEEIRAAEQMPEKRK
jgi:hypothetical protein